MYIPIISHHIIGIQWVSSQDTDKSKDDAVVSALRDANMQMQATGVVWKWGFHPQRAIFFLEKTWKN
jgi:hypothetical protein